MRPRSADAAVGKIDLQFPHWLDGRMGERSDGDSDACAANASLAVLVID